MNNKIFYYCINMNRMFPWNNRIKDKNKIIYKTNNTTDDSDI